MKFRSLSAAVAAGTGAALLVTGCSGSSSTATPATSTSTAASASAASGSASATAAGGPASATGGGPSSSATSAMPAANGEWPSPTASLKGVTLTYWSSANAAHLPDKVFAAFEAATGVKINHVVIPDVYETNAPTKLATGAKPDLAGWQPTGSELALLKPSTGLQNLDGAPWLAKQEPGVQNLGEVNGHHYSAFINVPSVLGIFYNKAAFAKAGITTTPKNFADLLADAQKIKATGTAPFFGAAGDKWPTQWWPQVLLAEASKSGMWEQVNQHKLTFNQQPIIGAIQSYQDMVKQGLFNKDDLTSTYNESGPALLAGQAAMVLQLTSFTSLLQATANTATIDSKIGWFPISKNGNIATSVPGGEDALVAFKTGDAKREAASRQLLEFWLETDYPTYIAQQQTVSLEPSVPTPADVPQVEQEASTSLTGAAGSMQQNAVANPDLYVYLADMAAGAKSPADVATATQNQFAQIAQAEGLPGF